MSETCDGAKMVWTMNLCLLFSLGSYSKGCSITANRNVTWTTERKDSWTFLVHNEVQVRWKEACVWAWSEHFVGFLFVHKKNRFPVNWKSLTVDSGDATVPLISGRSNEVEFRLKTSFGNTSSFSYYIFIFCSAAASWNYTESFVGFGKNQVWKGFNTRSQERLFLLHTTQHASLNTSGKFFIKNYITSLELF